LKNNQLKVVTVLIVLGVSLGLLLFLQKTYTNNFVERPVQLALQTIKSVEKVQVSKIDGIYQFKVQIKKAGNIMYDYNKVDAVIQHNIKGKEYQVQLLDKPNEKLQQELEYLELRIYEAMAKNNYIWLDEIFRQTSQQDHFAYKLYIDDKRLYIQLVDGDHFIYEIIERSSPASKGLNEGE